ncbi:hypothetical protein [Actinokineospora enzanensis]|uniref:hypothetical protein n=1 Tax=Actinokineospora enzanensis TaxID=155975 RepID=UPI0003690F74|nr:hypothetical protein [Actinokineospora enzanensis]
MTNVDAVRALAVSTITGRSASDEVVDLIEERVHDHTLSYPSSAPKHALGALVADIGRVQRLAGERQPATVQGRLSAASAVLFTLGADALMKLGDSTRARRWYQTAMMAAGDAGRPELRALVHAQQTMLSYYSGRFDEAVELARNAQQLLSGRPCGPAALAAAAEGRALARLDDHRGAEQAIGKARDLVDKLGSRPPDVAFEFGEERLLLYLSGTLTYMGQHTRAERVQARALELYARRPHVVVDPALITLDQAIGRVAAGCPAEGCALATATLRDLDPEHHRTPLLLNRAREVITVVPAGHRAAAATELRELLAEQYERSR